MDQEQQAEVYDPRPLSIDQLNEVLTGNPRLRVPPLSRPDTIYRHQAGQLSGTVVATNTVVIDWREIPEKWVFVFQAQGDNVLVTVENPRGEQYPVGVPFVTDPATQWGRPVCLVIPGAVSAPQVTISAAGSTGYICQYNVWALSGYNFPIGVYSA